MRLSTSGLTIRTGPFLYTIRTNLPEVASFMGKVYAESPVVDHPEFSDFHVAVHSCRRFLQPWLRHVDVSVGGVPLFGPFPRQETFAYLEWGMNGCISRDANHMLLFHAASLERDGRGVLFLGKSGAGKSTLAAALALRGWRLLSDEFGLVTLDSSRLVPLARPICLKNEAIQLIRELDPAVVTTTPADVRRKGLLCHLAPPRESVRRMDEPATPSALVFINYQQDAESRLEAIPKAQAMSRAIESSFNYKELGRAGFECMATLVGSCGCYDLSYGDLEGAGRVMEGAL